MVASGKPFFQPDLVPHHALFDGNIHGLVVTCYENERPLRGLGGLIDWRLGGELSVHLRSGAISGKIGECVYVPVRRRNRIYPILLVGCGHAVSPGHREGVPEESLELIKKNLTQLKLPTVGISQQDWGGQTKEYFTKQFKGISVCITQ